MYMSPLVHLMLFTIVKNVFVVLQKLLLYLSNTDEHDEYFLLRPLLAADHHIVAVAVVEVVGCIAAVEAAENMDYHMHLVVVVVVDCIVVAVEVAEHTDLHIHLVAAVVEDLHVEVFHKDLYAEPLVVNLSADVDYDAAEPSKLF